MVELGQGRRVDVGRDLPQGVGDDGRRVDLEVDDGLGAEQLAQLHEPVEAPAHRRVPGIGRVLEMLGPDADDHPAVDEGVERRPRLGRIDPQLLSVAERDAEAALAAHDGALKKFIAGLPMNPATKMLFGRL